MTLLFKKAKNIFCYLLYDKFVLSVAFFLVLIVFHNPIEEFVSKTIVKYLLAEV
jgi:hypothetical protein